MMYENELYHHGIKGMKWGVRRYQNKDGSLTIAGKKREAKQTYKAASNKAFKEYEKGINNIEKNYKRGQMLSERDQAREDKVESNYKKATEKAKNDYKNAKQSIRVEQKQVMSAKAQKALEKVKKPLNKENAAKAAKKGAKIAGQMALASLYDDIFLGGAGKKVAKTTVKYTGRAVVSAWILANGGSDIRWYDN